MEEVIAGTIQQLVKKDSLLKKILKKIHFACNCKNECGIGDRKLQDTIKSVETIVEKVLLKILSENKEIQRQISSTSI